MDNISKIRGSIRAIASTGKGYGIYLAEVLEVSDQTCKVRVEGVTLSDVKLRATIDTSHSSQLLITPKKGSLILMADLSGGRLDNLAVFAFSEIEKVELNAPKIVFNSGKNDGMVKVNPLVKRLNAIEKDINSLKKVFSTWSPVLKDGGGALKLAATDWIGSSLSTTTKDDLENPNITH